MNGYFYQDTLTSATLGSVGVKPPNQGAMLRHGKVAKWTTSFPITEGNRGQQEVLRAA